MANGSDRYLDPEKPQAEVFEDFVNYKLEGLQVSLPCIVHKYYSSEQAVDVLLTIKVKNGVTGDYAGTDDLIISKIPVEYYASDETCGVILPVKKDTLGSIIVTDFDLSKWVFSNGNTPQDIGSLLTHFANSSYFRPGLRPYSRAIDNYDADNMTMFNDKMSVVLHPDGKIEIQGTKEMVAVLHTHLTNVESLTTHLETLGTHLQLLATNLNSATVVTALGASPFTPATIALLAVDLANIIADKANMTADKALMTTDKNDLFTMKV